jgi:hypothetical protein
MQIKLFGKVALNGTALWLQLMVVAPAPATDLSGAASLIRPEVSSLSVTDITVNVNIRTNVELIAVGQIPVLATNIDYQLVITNPEVIQLFYDTIILTNNVGDSGGDADSIYGLCDVILLTNITGTVTNLIPVGQLCVLNQYRTLIIVTNPQLPHIEYHTLVTTNLIFDPGDPRCWQTIYHTNFTFEAVTTTNTSVTNFDFRFAGSPKARGEVQLAVRGQRQSFTITAHDLLIDPLNPPAAMGVFIGQSVYSPLWHRVGIMSKAGTNNLYRFELTSPQGAPPALGVAHLADLAGQLLQLRDPDTNVYAMAVLPPLVPQAGTTSYQRRVPMSRPATSPSPKARGTIRVRYNAANGSSLLQVDARHLAAGNAYCVVYSPSASYSGEPCTDGLPLVRGRGRDLYDTARGDDLPWKIGVFINDIRDMAGANVFVVDGFGEVHLTGTIPGP